LCVINYIGFDYIFVRVYYIFAILLADISIYNFVDNSDNTFYIMF